MDGAPPSTRVHVGTAAFAAASKFKPQGWHFSEESNGLLQRTLNLRSLKHCSEEAKWILSLWMMRLRR